VATDRPVRSASASGRDEGWQPGRRRADNDRLFSWQEFFGPETVDYLRVRLT
jgi:hypothetical protein